MVLIILKIVVLLTLKIEPISLLEIFSLLEFIFDFSQFYEIYVNHIKTPFLLKILFYPLYIVLPIFLLHNLPQHFRLLVQYLVI